MDTLQTSQLLRKLSKQYGLLKKFGSGSATYYSLNQSFSGELIPNTGELIPKELHDKIKKLSPKARKNKLWLVILEICNFEPCSIGKMSKILNCKNTDSLKNNHINKMLSQGFLNYVFPENLNHPKQGMS